MVKLPFKVRVTLSDGTIDTTEFQNEIEAYYFFKKGYEDFYGYRAIAICLYENYTLIGERTIRFI